MAWSPLTGADAVGPHFERPRHSAAPSRHREKWRWPKLQQPTAPFGQQLRRAAAPLVGLLKVQYTFLADQVSGLILIATRGGNEQRKVSALREGVGQLRAQIEVATNKVYEHHAVENDEDGGNSA